MDGKTLRKGMGMTHENIIYVEDLDDEAPYVKVVGVEMFNVCRMIDQTNNQFYLGTEMQRLSKGMATTLYFEELEMFLEDVNRTGIEYTIIKKDIHDPLWNDW